MGYSRAGGTVRVNGHVPAHSVTPESVSETIRRLAAAQKPAAQGSPAYSRYVNRRLGRILAAVAFRVGLSPNQVTAISAAFTALSIASLALGWPSPWTGLLVTVGLLVGYAFDSADGQLARLRGGGTAAGEWLDHVVDSVKVTALHLAVLICWFRFYEVPSAVLLIPVGFALVSSVFFFVMILTDQLRRAHPRLAPAPAGTGPLWALRSLLMVPTDYDLLCAVFVLVAWPNLFVPVYALLGACTALLLIAALPKWFREMSAMR